MAFPASYPIKPVHPSPTLTWTNGVMTAVRQFSMPCESVGEFVYDMLSGNSVSLGIPATFPGFPSVFVETINVEPICGSCLTSPEGAGVITDPTTELEGYPSGASGSQSQDLEGCECLVIINYNTRVFDSGQEGVREGTYLTYERDASAEYMTLPNRKLYWSTGRRLSADHRQTVMIAVGDITVTWHFVDEADLCFTEDNLRAMQNHVNGNSYGGVFFPGVCADIFPPETLLFMGYSTSLDLSARSAFGSYGTTVDTKRTLKCHFKYKQLVNLCGLNLGVYGWNHGYDDTLGQGGYYDDPDDPDCDGCPAVARITDFCGNNMFPLAQFTNIFL